MFQRDGFLQQGGQLRLARRRIPIKAIKAEKRGINGGHKTLLWKRGNGIIMYGTDMATVMAKRKKTGSNEDGHP